MTCVHHWKIRRQDGKYSWGRCARRSCAAKRLFRNGWPNKVNWPKEREDRLREERRLKRRERRDGRPS